MVNQKESTFSVTGHHSSLSKWSMTRLMLVYSEGFQGVSAFRKQNLGIESPGATNSTNHPRNWAAWLESLY